MTSFFEKYFDRAYWSLCAGVFVFIALRAFLIPFSHDEAATFFFYIQNGEYLPYQAHIYTNNHVLNSSISHLLHSLFGSHRFVLRLPNVIAFVILCFGVYKHFSHLKFLSSKLLLVTFFILTIRFLDFFALCRGYGISISLMVLGLAYLQEYFHNKKFITLVLFSVCWQLALAANLVLVVALTILIFFIVLFQWREKLLFSPSNLVLLFFQLALLFFWIRFSFFYRDQGVLDSGVGEDYWLVTFKSLIQWLFGNQYFRLQLILLALFCLMLLKALNTMRITGWNPIALFSPGLFYCIVLSLLILAFYLQKKLLHINFPEDRTGIFFYIFFVLALAFYFERLPKRFTNAVSLAGFGLTVAVFLSIMNVSHFYSSFYQTMPKALFDRFKAEQETKKQVLTIGGHRVRELNYAFLNYRGGSELNPMDDSEQMRMNCDYYYALKREKPYYQLFYDEIGDDEQWDRVLLKRKEAIQHQEVFKWKDGPKYFNSNQEFFEFVRLGDSSLKGRNCLEVEVELFFKQVPKPLKAFLVFSVDNQKGETVYYKRVILNWLSDDLNGQKKRLKLTTGQMPKDFKNMVVYLWNIDGKILDFSVESLKIDELHAKGINFVIPQEFYPLVEKITQKPLL